MNVKVFLSGLLSRQDWVYLLSLLVPFVVYNLALKAYDVTSQPSGAGLTQTFGLMRSDIFFNLGYALFWVGLFAVARSGPLRWVVVVLLHAVTMLVVIVTTCAHQYFKDNGSTLDYGIIAEWIPKFDEIKPILTHDISLSVWMLLAGALFYAILGPWLVTRAVSRWWRWPGFSPAGTKKFPFWGSLGLCVLAIAFGSLSLLAGPGIAGAGESFARAPFVNLVVTGVEEATTFDGNYLDAGAPTENPAANVSLAETDQTQKRNVVLIHLESTRAQSVTPYNQDLKTTPFLDELAKSSLLAEQAYTVVPRTSKANVTVNCGVEPPLYPGPEFEPGGIPVPCLAGLLRDQNYNTVFFMSTSETMDNFGQVVRNFGYDRFYSSETMDKGDFQVTNTFGYEDDIMLKPSEQWLEEHGDQPFMAEYLTGTGHYGYECLGTRYGEEDFSEDDQLNRYLNCMRLQDIFVKNLIDQYKELGLYDNTIFVIYGDHGEGFGEHGRYMHGDTIWEEGLRVPLIIHDPKRFQNGERIKGLANQTDIVPTVLELLGYEVRGGQYPGYSLLHPLPKDRTLRFSCITNRKCLASIKGNEKYIHHYDDLPDEFFDLSKDPLEEHNLADERSKREMEKRRDDLLMWHARVVAEYGGVVNLR